MKSSHMRPPPPGRVHRTLSQLEILVWDGWLIRGEACCRSLRQQIEAAPPLRVDSGHSRSRIHGLPTAGAGKKVPARKTLMRGEVIRPHSKSAPRTVNQL